MTSKRKVVVLLVLVLALLLGSVTVANAKKPPWAQPNQPPGNGKHEGPDPCEANGNCGNGDHGQGNPGNPGQGSAHANCNAAQGEVDPNCDPLPEIPNPPPLPVVVPEPTPMPEKRTRDSQQLRGVVASVLEIFSNEHPLDEDYVLAEIGNWKYLDFYSPPGESYVFLWWDEVRGHDGFKAYVCVESVSDNFVMISPFLRDAKKVNGVYMAPAFRTGDLTGMSDAEICAVLKHLADGGSIWPKQQVGG